MLNQVLIVEDQAMPRQLFEIFINNSDHFSLAGSISDAELTCPFCEKKHVDLILMDVITELGNSGLDAAEKIKRKFPEIKIIIVTSMPEFSWLKRAKCIGVDSFWYKDAGKDTILDIMERTMAGEQIYPDNTPVIPIGDTTNHEFTDRELEILRELMTGDSNAVIGERLSLSAGTVKRHVENMLSKSGFRTRTELVAEAGRLGIVSRL